MLKHKQRIQVIPVKEFWLVVVYSNKHLTNPIEVKRVSRRYRPDDGTLQAHLVTTLSSDSSVYLTRTRQKRKEKSFFFDVRKRKRD